jgi:hypothetical protein
MLNLKNLALLTVVTLVVVVAAVYVTRHKTEDDLEHPHKVFPELAKTLNDVADIHIKTETEDYHITRQDTRWGLQEKADYPVDIRQVRKVLLGLANLNILEAKTRNPALYAKLGLQDVEKEGSKAMQVTLSDKQGTTLGSLVLGRQQPAKTDATQREVYLRKPGDPQTWLAMGALNIPRFQIDWLNRQIVHIKGDRVQEVSVYHPDGETVVVRKDQPDAEYVLMDMPADASLKSQAALANLAHGLDSLIINDVFPAAAVVDLLADQPITTSVFTTFDGLRVTVDLTDKDGTSYVQLSAQFIGEATPPSEAEAEETTKQREKDQQAMQEAEDLNSRLKDWIFVISPYKAKALARHYADLVDMKSTPAPAADAPQ